MLERGKISSSQLGIMMFLAIIATVVLTVPSITGKYAGNDMWLSPFWASLSGFLTLYAMIRLHAIFPGMSIVEYADRIAGVIAGKCIGILYVFFFLQISGVIVRSYGEFIIGSFMERTPLIVVIGSMLLLSAYTVHCGVETVGRVAQFLLPIFVLPILFMPLLGEDMDFANIFPILKDGLTPSLMGAITPQAWFGEFCTISLLLPFVSDQDKVLRANIITIISITVIMSISNLLILFIFGHDVNDLVYPVMSAFSYIRIADFLENLESLVMAMWVVGAFVKIVVFHYVCVLSVSQWFRLSAYRPVVLPVTLLIGVFCFWSIPNLEVMLTFNERTFPFWGMFVQTFVPWVLLVVAWLRFRRRPAQPAGKTGLTHP